MSTDTRREDSEAVSEAILRWKPAAWLRVIGEDAATFLQGQFSNDVCAPQSAAVYGLWLNHKGRVLADSFVVAGGDCEFWVGSYFSPARVIRERLEAYIVADDVVVEDLTESWAAVTIFTGTGGPRPAADMPGFRFPGRRGKDVATEWVFPADTSARFDAWLAGASELTREQAERMRIAARIPAVPIDIGPGDLPNEGGLDVTAISYTKGCYLGQEVIARLRSMGQIRRRLFGVQADGAAPPLHAAIFQDERRIGELRSAVADGDGFVGLALLNLLSLRRDAPLVLGADGNESRVLRLGDPA